MIRTADHTGLVVHDLEGMIAFLESLGMVREGQTGVDGAWAGRVMALPGARLDIAVLHAPDGTGRLELARFHAPEHADPAGGSADAPLNRPGLRHVAFQVDDVDELVRRAAEQGFAPVGEVLEYEGVYRMCILRGPEGLLVELAQPLHG